MANLDPVWITLIGTLFAGVGLKVAEHWLGRNQVKVDDATQIRSELRQEITSQREEIKELESAVYQWREEYYNLRDKYITLQTELTLAVQRIRIEAEDAESTAKELEKSPPPTPAIDTDPPE